MPRKSAEERAATVFRSGGTVPRPPATLDKAAARVWRATVGAKPVGFFDRAALEQLTLYCTLTARAIESATEVGKGDPLGTPGYSAMVRQSCSLSLTVMTMAAKLKLTPQWTRQNGIHSERGPGPKVLPFLGRKARLGPTDHPA